MTNDTAAEITKRAVERMGLPYMGPMPSLEEEIAAAIQRERDRAADTAGELHGLIVARRMTYEQAGRGDIARAIAAIETEAVDTLDRIRRGEAS